MARYVCRLCQDERATGLDGYCCSCRSAGAGEPEHYPGEQVTAPTPPVPIDPAELRERTARRNAWRNNPNRQR